MFVNITKIFQKMKKPNWLSIEKYYRMRKKMLCYDYKKLF